MTTIYYAIIVAHPDDEPSVFRKPSALPFPCPIGTAVHVSIVDGYFAVVKGYSQVSMDHDELYMFLAPRDPGDLADIEQPHGGKCPADWFRLVDKEEFEIGQRALLADGWDLKETDLASYPYPF